MHPADPRAVGTLALVAWFWGLRPCLVWLAYVRRADLEQTYCFLKQTLNSTVPHLRHPEQADRWTWLVALAYTQLCLVPALASALRLPWKCRLEGGS